MQKVFIYWNLHKKMWSIKDWKTKKVIGHREKVMLLDCTFKVSEAGRQRVIATGHKNVHAGVLGYLTDVEPFYDGGDQAYYNPHKQDCFTVDGTPIHHANVVRFFTNRLVTVLK